MKDVYSSTFSVGKYTCEMTVTDGGNHTTMEWLPELPGRGSLTRAEVRQYQFGRNALFELVASETGKRVMIFE